MILENIVQVAYKIVVLAAVMEYVVPAKSFRVQQTAITLIAGTDSAILVNKVRVLIALRFAGTGSVNQVKKETAQPIAPFAETASAIQVSREHAETAGRFAATVSVIMEKYVLLTAVLASAEI